MPLARAAAIPSLVKAFTDDIINPLIAAAQGGVKGPGLGWQLVSGGGDGTYLNVGSFISAIIWTQAENRGVLRDRRLAGLDPERTSGRIMRCL